MKRSIAIAILGLAALSFSMAQTTLSNVEAKDARTMGYGGAFTTLTTGYDSLFGNPASFASSKGQLTIADFAAWGYVRPTQENLDSINALIPEFSKDSMDIGLIANTAEGLIAENGLGAGFSTGLGFTGRGIGIGVYVVGEAVASGTDILSSKLTSTIQVNTVFGFGIPLIKLGGLNLNLGADVRPFVRMDDDGTWLVNDILGALMNPGDQEASDAAIAALKAEPVNMGFGLAMDIGAQFSLGPLAAGITLRDITPTYMNVTEATTLGDFLSDPSAAMNADGADFVIDPVIAVGASFRPALIKSILEPGIYAEIKMPFSELDSIQAEVADLQSGGAAWNFVHVGADLRLFTILDVRAGLNQGYVCGGLGLNLFLVELDAAFFGQELGLYPGEEGRWGVSVQAAVHL